MENILMYSWKQRWLRRKSQINKDVQNLSERASKEALK